MNFLLAMFLLSMATGNPAAARQVTVTIDGEQYQCNRGSGGKIYLYNRDGCYRGSEIGSVSVTGDRVRDFKECVQMLDSLPNEYYASLPNGECFQIYGWGDSRGMCEKLFP